MSHYNIERYINTLIDKRSEHIKPFDIRLSMHNNFYPDRTEYRFEYMLAEDQIMSERISLSLLKKMHYRMVCQRIINYDGLHAFDTDNNKALAYLWERISFPAYPDREKLTKLALAESLK